MNVTECNYFTIPAVCFLIVVLLWRFDVKDSDFWPYEMEIGQTFYLGMGAMIANILATPCVAYFMKEDRGVGNINY